MATTVTVTRAHIYSEQYPQGSSGAFSSVTNIINQAVDGVEWLGNTVNAIGTYGGEKTIVANAGLLFDGSALYPAVDYGVDLGKSGTNRFSSVYASSIYADSALFDSQIYIADLSTAISQDVSGNLIFYDANVGTNIALSDLLTTSDIWEIDGSGYITSINGEDVLMPGTDRIRWGDGDTLLYESSDDVLDFRVDGNLNLRLTTSAVIVNENFEAYASDVYNIGSSSVWWNYVYASQYYINSTSTLIYESGGDMAFSSSVAGTVFLADIENLWEADGVIPNAYKLVDSSGKILVPTPVSTHLAFGDADTYIYESADDTLRIVVGSSVYVDFVGGGDISIYKELAPNLTGTRDIGTSLLWFKDLYIETVYIDDTSTYISLDSAGNMNFTDVVSGTQTLADLIGGGSSSPLTTKGDLWGYSTVDARIPVGSDGQALVADSSEALGVKWGTWGTIVYDVTLTDNSTTNITVGTLADNTSIKVMYSVVRGIEYRSGEITILNSGGVISDDGGSYFGDTCGITSISADTSGGNIRLNVTLDTASVGDGDMEYIVIYPDFSTSASPISYTHPNHSGEVTSVGDGAQTVTVSAITNKTALTTGLASTDELLVNDDGVIKRMDISVIQSYMQTNLSFGTGVWSRTGTDLSPATAGDSILLAVSTEWIKFGDGDSYIYESADDELRFVTGSNVALRLIFGTGAIFDNDILPDVTKVNDIGSSSLFWDNVYVDRLYIDDTSTYIDTSTGDMTFTDTNAGTVTLSSLVAGGGSSKWTDAGTYIYPTNGEDVAPSSTKGANLGTTSLFWDDAHVDRIYIYDTGNYIYGTADTIYLEVDSGAVVSHTSSTTTFYNNIVPSTTLTYDIGSSSLFWQYAHLERVYLTDTGNYIDSNSGAIYMFVDSGIIFTATASVFQVNKDITSGGTKTYDLGSTINFWDNVFVDRLYVDNTSTYIDVDGTGMTLTDATGTYQLSALGGGGGDVSASGTLTDNVVMVGAGSSTISTPDSTVSFGGYAITSVGSITSSSWMVTDSIHIGALNRVSIASTALPAMTFQIASYTKMVLDGGDLTIYVDTFPYTTKAYDLGSSSLFWDNVYVDRLYIDATAYYIDVNSGVMELTDTTGTYPINSVNAKYQAASHTGTGTTTTTPVVIFDIIRAYCSPTAEYQTGTLNVDLDTIESGNLSRVIHIRADLDNDFNFCTTNIVIRDSSNATILSWSNNTGAQVVYGAVIMWDNTESEWTVLSTYTN